MNCPLCSSSRSITTRKYRVKDLRNSWNKTFGFDPFPEDLSIQSIDKRKCSSCKLIYFDPPYYGDKNFYSKISQNAWYYESNKWEYDIAAEIVSDFSPKSLLEIGCGNGYFLEKIQSLGTSAHGVDINEDAVRFSKNKGLQVESRNLYDLETSYDMVVLFEVLEHLDEPKQLFDFFTTKLISPGGYLIIAVPNPDSFLKDIEMNLLDMPPHHNSSWSLDTFKYLSESYGLQLVDYKKEPLRYAHYFSMTQNMLNEHAKIMPQTFKVKLFLKIQKIISQLLSPLTYMQDKTLIDGQTHLVVLKNVR